MHASRLSEGCNKPLGVNLTADIMARCIDLQWSGRHWNRSSKGGCVKWCCSICTSLIRHVSEIGQLHCRTLLVNYVYLFIECWLANWNLINVITSRYSYSCCRPVSKFSHRSFEKPLRYFASTWKENEVARSVWLLDAFLCHSFESLPTNFMRVVKHK
jgi:hypothetical protein